MIHNLSKFTRVLDRRSLIAFGLPFTLYLLTLSPTISSHDSAELTSAAATLGFTRSTGYPVYILIGYLWSHIPIGDVGFRLNLFSAFNGALTIFLLELIFRRLQLNKWAVFGALGLLTSALFFWAMSITAEVYTLHTAFISALLLCLLHLADQPTDSRLMLVGFIFGLSLGNHLATILLLPAIIPYVAMRDVNQNVALRPILKVVMVTLLGLCLYLYFPIRSGSTPNYNYAGSYNSNGVFTPLDFQSIEQLIRYVTGGEFQDLMFVLNAPQIWNETLNFAKYMWSAFFGIGVGPGILGLILMLKRMRRVGIMTFIYFICHAFFFINYKVIDKETMYLPNLLIWSLWIGIGLDWMIATLRQERNRLGIRATEGLLCMLIIGFVVFSLVWNWPLVDLSDDWSARERGEEILGQVEANALIFGYWDTIPVIEFLQKVENKRPDVQAINRFLITPEDMATLIEQEISLRPIYIDSFPTTLPQTITGQSEGLLYQLEMR
jgi:hypothetical protein